MVSAIFSYVAVVSDNDGSAFITKAEFDSLKNNFQAQIDNYNQSIDSKIDGAIASYLAGIKVNTVEGPEFVIYGADAGTWNSKPAAKFYMLYTGSGSGGWGPSDVAGDGPYLRSLSKSDLGFGYGRWMYRSNSNALLDIDPKYVGFYSVDAQLMQMYNSYRYVRVTVNGGASFTTQDCGTNSSTTLAGLSDWKATLYQEGLSVAFQQCIRLISPEIKLVEFRDSGDGVQFNFCFIANGYQYEGGTHGGKNQEARLDNCKLELIRGGIAIKYWKLSTVKGLNWFTLTFDANAGDYIQFNADGQSSGGTSGEYGIFFFGKSIPGWTLTT